MSVINNGILLGAGADAAVGYQVSRSLRFNAPDSAYLSRTPGSAGDRNKWTFSCWVKLGAGLANNTFSVFTANSGNTGLIIRSGSGGSPYQIEFATQSGATVPLDLITTRVFRDYGAWFHLLFYFDLANSTQADRAQIYINGVRETIFSTNTNTISTSSVGRDINNTSEHRIGAGNGYADGYLADVHFCDGYAYDPTSFTETDAITGQLIPKAFTGSYGTNGFRLPFSDNSGTTAATLGKDAAGSNNWTPNNFSVASGAGNDSLVDSPTGYGTDTGAGGEVRGNYATLNPLNIQVGAGSLSNGNLDFTGPSGSSAYNFVGGTFGIDTSTSTGWYFEVTQATYGQFAAVSLLDQGVFASSLNNLYVIGNSFANQTAGISYSNVGSVSNYGTVTTGLTSWTSNGDVIGVAIKDNKIWFAKNNTWISGSPSAGTSPSITLASTKYVTPALIGINSSVLSLNAGQRAFAYTAPSGYKALCSHNLPEPTILKGNTAMDVKLYTGNGSTQTISGLGFSPDLVWIKGRSIAADHGLFDIVRGTTKRLVSNATQAEDTQSGVTAFNSNGFDLGSYAGQNNNNDTYAAWAWDCGSSTVTNTSGSISSQVRASATNGCSVVTYTGTGSNATVGHGLGVAPSFIIVKSRTTPSTTGHWFCYHADLGNTKGIFLNLTNAAGTSSTYWNNTSPTSSVFSISTEPAINQSTITYVSYCFAPVAGFSAFGSYTGNGSSDGPFVYCGTGFRPRWIMIKASSTGGTYYAWYLYDTARSTYNATAHELEANRSVAEGSGYQFDILSNGFKVRSNAIYVNSSGVTYVWAAFAESPFKYSRAR